MIETTFARPLRFTVQETIDMNAPFPQAEDRVELRTRRGGATVVRISSPEGEPIATLEGQLDRHQHCLVGDYDIYGRFHLKREKASGGLRLRCELRDPGRGEAGCWVADEDDT